MSRFDFQEFARVVNEFKYKPLAINFAANSINLSRKIATRRVKGSPYIWIDAPWQLWQGRTLVTESISYPDPHTVSGPRKERRWLKNAGKGFDKQALLSLTLYRDRIALFRFSGGWTIHASGWAADRNNEMWYDDWYAKGRSASP